MSSAGNANAERAVSVGRVPLFQFTAFPCVQTNCKGDWYEQVFSGPGSEVKITIESTTAYSTLPLFGIKDVRPVLGDVSIVYIIRDPLNRFLSQFRMKASHKYGDKPISESEWTALRDNMRERGDCKSYIPRWLSVFPESSTQFIPFKRFDVPPSVVDLLTKHVAPQYAFLEQHFGKDFMDMI